LSTAVPSSARSGSGSNRISEGPQHSLLPPAV